MNGPGRVHLEREDTVARIVFDNPGALNALSLDMWREMAALCGEIARMEGVRVATLRGVGGRAFVSGTDIAEFTGFESGRDGIEYERTMDRCLAALEDLPIPTIAVIEGWATGGGLALSCACDFRIATPGARFGSPIARTLGNCLSATSYARIVRHAGIPLSKRMLLLGDILTADELFAAGLLLEVAEPDKIDETAGALCARLSALAPISLKASKQAIRRLTYASVPDIDDLIEETYGSRDFSNGVKRFLSKTKQKWEGR